MFFRGRGMKPVWPGPERFEVFIGATVLTNNLLNIAHLLNQKTNGYDERRSHCRSQTSFNAPSA